MAQMKYYYELTVSSSPHAHQEHTTRTIMRDVLIALVPALLFAMYNFGARALTVTAVSMISCYGFEKLWNKWMKKHDKSYDLSACVTGMLLAFVCPVTVAYWQIILGAAFSILLVKMLFGGLGRNVVNPALAGRAFMMSWPVAMSTWITPGAKYAASVANPVDVVTAATPLANMHQGMMPDATIWEMAWGTVGGCIGETSAIMLLIGLVYLLVRKVIKITIPAAYIGTVALLTLLFPGENPAFQWMLCQIFGGGLMLGAIFMATDYVTSPLTKWGQIIYGIGCGALTVLIRYFGGYNEGVSYAILVMNTCVVLLDRVGRPVKFGAPKPGKEAAK